MRAGEASGIEAPAEQAEENRNQLGCGGQTGSYLACSGWSFHERIPILQIILGYFYAGICEFMKDGSCSAASFSSTSNREYAEPPAFREEEPLQIFLQLCCRWKAALAIAHELFLQRNCRGFEEKRHQDVLIPRKLA